MRLALAYIALSSATAVSFAQQYTVYSDGAHGTLTGTAGDWNATYQASAFLSRGGCSTTANISTCYAADVAADPTKQLATADAPPYVAGGVGTRQRALLLSQPHVNSAFWGIVNHRVRVHISTSFAALPAGAENAITLTGLRNANSSIGLKAFDVRIRNFVGEETAGTSLYVAVVDQDGSEDFPAAFPLAKAVGRTIVIQYDLGINGRFIGYGTHVMARITATFADTGEELFVVDIPESRFIHGIVDSSAHRLIYGVDRQAAAGQQQLKIWFGDYFAAPDADAKPPF